MRKTVLDCCGVALLAFSCFAGADRLARVDAEGVLRWQDDATEVALLGVNYYAPFTIDYAGIEKLGLDPKQVIRDDVAHFRRLGLGCIRIHCFDREFSDAEGNLLDNKHLELLDFVVDECRRNGLYTVLTPIAWWGNMIGKTDGFSDRYTMQQMTTDRQSWKPQARFLKQFAEHTNRYTAQRYADDPAVLAFECINEPQYPKDTPDSLVTEYINTLADALRAGGTTKPIYYNSWQGRNGAAGAARIEGVTCSSYPTGLASGRALWGPQLPRAKGSCLQPNEAIAHKSRMVYEFDAADVPGSHMYPSLAKFFRSEGVQVAAQFQYDPLPLAAVNHNWMTHHLSLVYTPGKALSLAIAAEVFKRVPRGAPFGQLPAAAVFPPFRSSAEADLSEMVTDEAFLTSNATTTPPPRPQALTRVWGCGASPVVSYEGSGAYFLDRVSAGVWRLQLYPDVFTVADPYSGTTETKVRVLPGSHVMALRLPDLGDAFTVRTFDGQTAGDRLTTGENGTFEVPPGDYLLTRSRGFPKAATLREAAAVAPRYVSPRPDRAGAPLLRAEVAPQWRAATPLVVQATAALATHVTVQLASASGGACSVPMASTNAGFYTAVTPADALKPGSWAVSFRATGAAGESVFPDGNHPDARWFPALAPAIALLRVPKTAGASEGLTVSRSGFKTTEVSIVSGRMPDTCAVRLVVDGFGEQGSAAGYSLPFPASAAPGTGHAGLRIVARGGDGGARIELGFRMKNGQGLGCNLQVGKGWSETIVPVKEMLPLWGLPSRDAFLWQEVERVSVLTGAWLWRSDNPNPQAIDLASIEWVRLELALPLFVTDGSNPWNLFDMEACLRASEWTGLLRRWRVTDDAGRAGLHLGTDSFSGEHESFSLRIPCDGKTFAQLWQTDGERAVLHIRARAACPRTTGFELALIEASGVPWGLVVPLTTEWQTLHIPLSKLRLFTQWGNEYAAQAGPHLRLSRLETINVCFGKWLYGKAANEPHAIEIAEIGVTAE